MSERALQHLPRDTKFWEQVRDAATALGTFLSDHRRNQFREATVTGMLAGHFTQLHVFDRSDTGGICVSVSIEVEEDDWVDLLRATALSTLDTMVDAAEEGEEAA